jgi:hypothetical protein
MAVHPKRVRLERTKKCGKRREKKKREDGRRGKRREKKEKGVYARTKGSTTTEAIEEERGKMETSVYAREAMCNVCGSVIMSAALYAKSYVIRRVTSRENETVTHKKCDIIPRNAASST